MDCTIYQKQIDEAGIPIDISQFGDQDEQVIQCIMGGLLLFKAKDQVKQDAAV